MPRIVTKKKKVLKIEAGSLNSRITLYYRNLETPSYLSVDFDESISKRLDVWAMIESVNGLTIFDSTNIEKDITHKFYTRYIPNITFQNWIEHKHKYYRIHKVENNGNENKFYILWAEFRGDKDKRVNIA